MQTNTLPTALQFTCIYYPQVNGKYFAEGGGYFHENNARYELTRCSAGFWGILEDGRQFLVLAKAPAADPTGVTIWSMYDSIKRQHGQGLKEAVTIKILVGEQAPSKANDWTWYTHPTTGKRIYRNTKTQKEQETVPPAVSNVGQKPLSLHDHTVLPVFWPLISRLQSDSDGKKKQQHQNVVKDTKDVKEFFHAVEWRETDGFWQGALQSLEAHLSGQVTYIAGSKKGEASREQERHTLEETLKRINENIVLYEEKVVFALERSKNMTQRLGRVHTKRDDDALPSLPSNTSGTFPSGEEIKRRYEATFGAAFEGAAAQAIAYLQDTLQLKADAAMAVLVSDVIAPLFKQTANRVLTLIGVHSKRLQEVFGLPTSPEDTTLGQNGEISIARQFFLASQQEPLLAAAENTKENALQEIFTAAGSKAADMRANMSAWAAKKKVPLTFDLTKIARELLWVHAAIELSDPKCYLYPEPGLAVSHEADSAVFTEVFRSVAGAGGKALAVGESAQVVVPGLFFDVPTVAQSNGASGPSLRRNKEVVPQVPVQVRRHVA